MVHTYWAVLITAICFRDSLLWIAFKYGAIPPHVPSPFVVKLKTRWLGYKLHVSSSHTKYAVGCTCILACALAHVFLAIFLPIGSMFITMILVTTVPIK